MLVSLVVTSKQHKSFRADLLVIIPGERQRELRDQRQQRAEPIGAQPVGCHASPQGEADIELVFPFRDGVGQQRLQPIRVRELLNLPVAVAVHLVLRSILPFVPGRNLHGEGRKENGFPPTPAQAGAQAAPAHVIGHHKIVGRVRIRVEGRITSERSEHPV